MGNSLGEALSFLCSPGDSRGSSWNVPQDTEGPAQCHPVPKSAGMWGEKTQPSFPGDLEGPWRCPSIPAVTLRVALILNFAVPTSPRQMWAVLFDVPGL